MQKIDLKNDKQSGQYQRKEQVDQQNGKTSKVQPASQDMPNIQQI